MVSTNYFMLLGIVCGVSAFVFFLVYALIKSVVKAELTQLFMDGKEPMFKVTKDNQIEEVKEE